MSEPSSPESLQGQPGAAGPAGGARIHWLQKLMDNPWLLLALGLLVPLLSYTLWGWIELATMAPSTLP